MIASVVRETIAPALRDCPPACGVVSITDVEVSSDLSYATVLVSALREPEKALEALEEERPELQRLLGKRLQTHRVPRLRFRIDQTIERAERIDRLLEGG